MLKMVKMVNIYPIQVTHNKINTIRFFSKIYFLFFIQVPGLVHYWPIVEFYLLDFGPVGQRKDLWVAGGTLSYGSDRFGLKMSSANMNKGVLKAPTGVYLSGAFTATVWIYLFSYQSYARIFDFGNGEKDQNVAVYFEGTSGRLKLQMSVKSDSVKTCQMLNNYEIPLNQWTHVAVAYDGEKTAYIFINGVLHSNCINTMAPGLHLNMETRFNYIGKSNSANELLYLDGYIDELKFYDRVLRNDEISSEMSSNYMTTLPLNLPDINKIS
jgi:hypothetical protein